MYIGFKRLVRHEVIKSERVHTLPLRKHLPLIRNALMKKQYTRFTEDERIELYAYLKQGLSMIGISDLLGRHRSTLYRELKRNTGLKGYRPKQADLLAEERKQRNSFTKWTQEIEDYVKLATSLDYSPKQICTQMRLDKIPKISHERIYQFLIQDKKNGGKLYTHLRIMGKRKYKKRYGKNDYRGQIPNRIDISKRPKAIDDRIRFGDWEADLVSGSHHKGFLVTLVDRKSRYTLIGHVRQKTAELVTAETIRLLKESCLRVRSITYDNGREFNGHMEVSREMNCKTYFARPYHSWERGTNENTNGLIRQYFPKGSNLRYVNSFDLLHAMNRINNRPKEVLGNKTPQMVAYNTPRVALAS